MSKHDGGAAFPWSHYHGRDESGMTLRDWFAGTYQIPFLIQIGLFFLSLFGRGEEMEAKMRYEYADAMLQARQGGTE